ncbi:MAG: hypothetical protein JXJ04_19510 [Spirochaetales bacterium]|nr:hypothetical protein [Spirochaetales bacterium]
MSLIIVKNYRQMKQKCLKDFNKVIVFLIVILFLMIFLLPLHGESNSFKTRIQQSFINYKEDIFNTYSSIEFIDTTDYKKTTNDICTTHYQMTAFYSIDLIKKRVFSKILAFTLICGKNEKKRYVGMETQIPLKNLYLFSDFINKQWNQILLHKEESYLSFKASEWFIPLAVTFYYDSDNYFPARISVLSDDNNIDISMKHSKHSGIYLMDELTSLVTLDYILGKDRIETFVTRTHYVLRLKDQ